MTQPRRVVRMRPAVTAVVFDEAAEHVLLLWRHRIITDTWGPPAHHRSQDHRRDTLIALSLALAASRSAERRKTLQSRSRAYRPP
jgi:hypothetical protein